MTECLFKKEIKEMLVHHIKDLNYHSARKSEKGKVLKWNTPIMNEFVAFGAYVANMIDKEWKQKIKDMIAEMNDEYDGEFWFETRKRIMEELVER